MVRVAHRGRPVAALGCAAAVTEAHRDSLGFAVEPALAAHVEDLALASEHSRDDAGTIGQTPSLGSRELNACVQGADASRVQGLGQLLAIIVTTIVAEVPPALGSHFPGIASSS